MFTVNNVSGIIDNFRTDVKKNLFQTCDIVTISFILHVIFYYSINVTCDIVISSLMLHVILLLVH